MYGAHNTSIPSEIIELRTPLGRWTQWTNLIRRKQMFFRHVVIQRFCFFAKLWILRISNYWVFSIFWKNISSKVGFSMTNYPNFVVFHVSTTFRKTNYTIEKIHTRKMSAFCLKLTYTLFEKMYEVTKNTIFDFSFFFIYLKKRTSKIGFSMKSYPIFLFFTSLRLVFKKYIQ